MKGDERGTSVLIILISIVIVLLVMSPIFTLEINAYKHSEGRAQNFLEQY